MKYASAGLLCLMFVSPASAETTDFSACPSVMQPYEAAYVSTLKGIRLKGHRSLRLREDGAFLLSHSARVLGGRTAEQSLFRLVDNQLKVERYDMELSIIGIKREEHAVFDRAAGVITTWGRKDRTLKIERPTFDGLSYQLALRCDMAQGKQMVHYTVLNRAKVGDFIFRVVGEERLKTNLGELETVVVDRVRESSNRSTRIWVAPALNHLMVRLEHSEEKENADFILELDGLNAEGVSKEDD